MLCSTQLSMKVFLLINVKMPTIVGILTFMSGKNSILEKYEGISKSFEPNMERARNLDLFCFIFQRSPLPTPHTCPI